MRDYKEEEFLALSGIQHFVFCKRQWALIHIEQQWADNHLTIKGNHIHRRVDDASLSEKRNDVVISRSLPVHSRELGINGVCDVVEFHKTESGTYIRELDGKYIVIPVEYKRGRPKEHDADVLQVAAQAMCLEEMLCTQINKAYLFYGETKHRMEIEITQELRKKVSDICEEMHGYFKKSYTPKCKADNTCNNCSLYEICNPKLCGHTRVSDYINTMLEEKAP